MLDVKARIPNHLGFSGSHRGGGGGEGARGGISLSDLSRVGLARALVADVPAMLDLRFIVLGGVNIGYVAALGYIPSSQQHLVTRGYWKSPVQFVEVDSEL